jgi:hypothetical protein
LVPSFRRDYTTTVKNAIRRTETYTVLRYVEWNALRAGLVHQAEAWRWGSLWRRGHAGARPSIALHTWPVPEPRKTGVNSGFVGG